MKLISVMIVDDEKLALEDLMSIVDWEALGFDVIATAFNGKQALTKFKQSSPQIVFTDIKMPIMDGVELIENIRELDKQAVIVVLSAYEDFTYAQTAIRFGITEYLIKSEINRASLTEVLIKLRNKINRQNKNSFIIKTQSISNFFQTNEISCNSELAELFGKEYCYIIIEQNMPISINGENVAESIRCSKANLELLIANENYGELELVTFGGLPKGQTLMAFYAKENGDKCSDTFIKEKATDIKILLEKTLNCSFTIYYSGRSMFIENFKRLLFENANIFEQKYFINNTGLIDISTFGLKRTEGDVNIDKELLKRIGETQDVQAFDNYIDFIYEKAVLSGKYKNLFEISRYLYFFLVKIQNGNSDGIAAVDLSAKNNWKNWLTFEEIAEWNKIVFLKFNEYHNSMKQKHYSRVIQETMAHIQSNFSNSNLTIRDIAEHVHLSSGYLCAQFKSETSTTINNYIIDVRITAAKKLLTGGHDKIYEVANAVGYVSSQYFSQVFYKKTGIYPNEYKRGDII
ncbi:MAG: response regulator [Christensenellaceae bacterium]